MKKMILKAVLFVLILAIVGTIAFNKIFTTPKSYLPHISVDIFKDKRQTLDSLTERKGYLKAINDISTQLVKFNIPKAVDSVLKIKDPEQRERARFYLAGKLDGFHCVIKILDSLNK